MSSSRGKDEALQYIEEKVIFITRLKTMCIHAGSLDTASVKLNLAFVLLYLARHRKPSSCYDGFAHSGTKVATKIHNDLYQVIV